MKTALWTPSHMFLFIKKKKKKVNILFMLLFKAAMFSPSFFLLFFSSTTRLVFLCPALDSHLFHYAFLHFPFFSRCWNFRSLRAQVSLHWMTRLPLSATTPLCPGESSSLPSSRYFFPGLIFGHLQATSFALTHKNWSPLRIRLSPCL